MICCKRESYKAMSKILTLHGYVEESTLSQLNGVELLVLDVDGTLTDGQVILGGDDLDIKCFSAKDGLGLHLLHVYSIAAAIITGRSSQAVARRARELHIDHVLMGVSDKGQALLDLREQLGLQGRCACIGDDLNDVPMFRHSDFTACPQDASSYIKTISHYVLMNEGGHGAVRELIDLILIAKGHMDYDGGLTDFDAFLGASGHASPQ